MHQHTLLSNYSSRLLSHIFSNLSFQSLSMFSRFLFAFLVDFGLAPSFSFRLYRPKVQLLPVESSPPLCSSLLSVSSQVSLAGEFLRSLKVVVVSMCIFEGSTLSHWPIIESMLSKKEKPCFIFLIPSLPVLCIRTFKFLNSYSRFWTFSWVGTAFWRFQHTASRICYICCIFHSRFSPTLSSTLVTTSDHECHEWPRVKKRGKVNHKLE